MTLAIAKMYIDVTPPEVMPGGVLDAANVVDVTGHELLGGEYVTDACVDGGTWLALCSGDYPVWGCPTAVPPTVPFTPAILKRFERPNLVEGEPFVVYAGVECEGDYSSDAEWTAKAEARLAFTEGRQVDMFVEAWLAANSVPIVPGPSDIVTTIGVMENWASMVYGGVPTLLFPRAAVTRGVAEMAIMQNLDKTFFTANGSNVASLANTELATSPTFGYATGQITMLRGPVQTIVVPEVTRPDGTCDPRRALAERIYVPLVECVAGNLGVTLP